MSDTAHDVSVDFDALPSIDAVEQSRADRTAPRFDGDISELPDRACWALQHLLSRRYIRKDTHAELWSWVTRYRHELTVRLSELDLRLCVADDHDIAYVEQAEYESQWRRKLLRRETLNTYDSILALHLAKLMRAAARDEHVLISREDVHELFADVHNDTDRDIASFNRRIDNAIERLTDIEVLVRNREDEDSFTVSPVINAIMTASVITELQQQFEQLKRAANGAGDDDSEDSEAELLEDKVDTHGR
ncbi:DUF4194 domain-containing protein [Mycobacterium sp. 21AC1]|uniref:DUF4194 domain-containing protein n=1 Tax=[Mycobacterium] appelbergii TaxID=2939269 RepID=UPI0029390918|nr:DUF4194 domain-containing protein [Mycobacterium sp. 21AC1]MDV3128628.1 DUF4194 domain-containing protein [Mycobacterium sp. 21AC1]